MTKNETMEEAARKYADVDAAKYRNDSRGLWEYSQGAFMAGAKWQADQELRNLARDPGSLDGARLVPRTPAVSGEAKQEGRHAITPPAWAGTICDVIQFGGGLYVACQNGIFRLDGGVLTPLRFVAK